MFFDRLIRGTQGCEATRYYMNFTLKIPHRNVQYQGVKRALTGLFCNR